MKPLKAFRFLYGNIKRFEDGVPSTGTARRAYTPFRDESKLNQKQAGYDAIERLTTLNKTPEVKKRSSEIMKKLNSDPKFIAARAEALKKRHADPKFREENSARMIAMNKTKENSERRTRMNNEPEFKKASIEHLKAYHAARRKK